MSKLLVSIWSKNVILTDDGYLTLDIHSDNARFITAHIHQRLFMVPGHW